MIEVHELVKKYGDYTAVDHLSFRAEEGKIYGFLGPNGAGKTTTMNMITGYLASTSGEIRINGHDILEEPEEAKKCIGYMPENPPLYQEMTPYEQLCFAAELKGIPSKEREEHVASVMKKTGVEPVADRLIRHLSKGYKQRVGFAQALLGYPEVLILDEPMSGLDPIQIIEIRDLIKSLAGEHTIILSSHILSEVQVICDQVLIISHGKLAAADTPENLGKRMHRSQTLTVEISGDAQMLMKKIAEIPGVVSVEESASDLENVFLELTENEKKEEEEQE